MEPKTFAVFLSHNSEDKSAVEKIAIHLEDNASLRPWFDKWTLIPGEQWQRNLERGLNASSTCAVFVGKNGEGPWQKNEVDLALRKHVKSSNFRVIPVILPEAPTHPELPPFVEGHTWVDFSNGLDDDDALWRLECGIRGVPPGRGRPKSQSKQQVKKKIPGIVSERKVDFDQQNYIIPGGALGVDDSRFYIKRKFEDKIFKVVRSPNGMVNVCGAWQTGKTSLIYRIISSTYVLESNLRVALIDFQRISGQEFKSLDRIWFNIVSRIASKLKIKGWSKSDWDKSIMYDDNISNFLECVFLENDNPLLICFDEVDRVFNSKIKTDFFASVRSFYNSGKIDRRFKRLRWMLSTSSEPSFFIDDLNQSPFNVGYRVELCTFNKEEVEEFASRHGQYLRPDELNRIMDYVGGRPYLVHNLLYHIVQKSVPYEMLFDAESAGGAIFQDHLNHYLLKFQQDKSLKEAMKKVIFGKGCRDKKLEIRLKAAGLVQEDEHQKVIPLCKLYSDFFRKEL